MTFMRILQVPAIGLVLFAAAYGFGMLGDSDPQGEVEELAGLLGVGQYSVVAEIGAGDGQLTGLMSEIAGSVYATEMPGRLEDLKRSASSGGNVTVMKADVETVGLPEACCDAIYMRRVYHHFTRPDTMTASLFASVKPGGRVAVIDFEPRWWRVWIGLPDGVPANRGGHGMPVDILIDEMTAAGFEVGSQDLAWWSFPENRFCVVFRRP